MEERNASNVVTRRFYHQGEQISGANYYYMRDHLGSVRELTDSTGAVRARYDYNAYGYRTKLSGDLDTPFGFTGFYYHAYSGLNLALYRAYDFGTGRWLSTDPIEESGDVNLYRYVSNKPLSRTDLLGLDSLRFDGYTLIHFDNSGNVLGSYPGTSGRPGITDPALRNQGPIPPGDYILNPWEITAGGLLRNLFGDWGKYRAPLHPQPCTDTQGRNNFFLHGGKTPGSAGCIDIGSNDKILLPKLQLLKEPVPVLIVYPPSGAPPVTP